jgi:tripartite-type tricarboxylate transporter receptor subunit TctC
MFPAAGGATSHVKAGRLRALAVGSAEPTTLAPGVPTIAAMGVPGYVSDAVHAVFAPVRVPAAVVDKLNQEIARYLRTADAKEKFFNTGAEPVSSSPEELAVMMKSEMERIAKVVKAAGITPR